MKKLTTVCAMAFLLNLFTITVSHAATVYTTTSIEKVFVGDGKITLVVTGDIGARCFYQTGNKSLFVKALGESDSNAILSLLLTAKSTGKLVELAYYDEGNATGSFYDVNNVGQTFCTIRWVMM